MFLISARFKSTGEVRRFECCLEFVEHWEEETRITRKQIAQGKVKVNKKGKTLTKGNLVNPNLLTSSYELSTVGFARAVTNLCKHQQTATYGLIHVFQPNFV